MRIEKRLVRVCHGDAAMAMREIEKKRLVRGRVKGWPASPCVFFDFNFELQF